MLGGQKILQKIKNIFLTSYDLKKHETNRNWSGSNLYQVD